MLPESVIPTALSGARLKAIKPAAGTRTPVSTVFLQALNNTVDNNAPDNNVTDRWREKNRLFIKFTTIEVKNSRCNFPKKHTMQLLRIVKKR